MRRVIRKIAMRIASYEMAYRMQSSAPELIPTSARKPTKTLAMYGAEPGKVVWYANNCLLSDDWWDVWVRFVQLYHTDWDHHGEGSNNLGPGLDLVPARRPTGPANRWVRDLQQRGWSIRRW